MSTFTAKTWHKEGSSYPILIDQNPETPIQCYYALLNRAFGKHLAEPVPATHEWANFDKLDWKCSGEDLEEYDYKDLPEKVKLEYKSIKIVVVTEMEKLGPKTDKYKIFQYFVHALEDGEEHLRFFVNDDFWYLVNWGMNSDPRYVLMLQNPSFQEEKPEDDDYVEKFKDSILNVRGDGIENDDATSHLKSSESEILDDGDFSDELVKEVPPYIASEEYVERGTSNTSGKSFGWLKWLFIILLILLLLFLLFNWLAPASAVSVPIDAIPSATQTTPEGGSPSQKGEESEIVQEDIPQAIGAEESDKPSLGENTEVPPRPQNPEVRGSSESALSPDIGDHENTQDPIGNHGSNPHGSDQSNFSDPNELKKDDRKNFGGLEPKDNMGLPLNDDLQSRVLVGEIYRYEDEYGVVYYLLDNASGKKFLLDYEPYKNENSESPSTKESLRI